MNHARRGLGICWPKPLITGWDMSWRPKITQVLAKSWLGGCWAESLAGTGPPIPAMPVYPILPQRVLPLRFPIKGLIPALAL